MRIECPNYLIKEKTKRSKGKVLVATLSDIESDLFDKFEDEYSKNMAFATTTGNVIVENVSDSEDSSDDEAPKKLTLQEAYDKLCTEYIKSEKTSYLCRKNLMR